MPRYDIIIPHYGSGHVTELAKACLRSIAAAGGDFRVILVDNASPELGQLWPELQALGDRVVVNAKQQNLGFIKATNAGLAISNAPYVVFLNNDTEVVSGWLESLEECFSRSPLIGLAGPLTTTPDSWQGKWIPSGQPIHVLAPGRMLAFFCTMFSRACIEKVGPLDESYGVGFGDDDDYCRRAERAGFRLALRQDLVIKHHHRSTFKLVYSAEEITALQAAAMDRFRRTGAGRPERPGEARIRQARLRALTFAALANRLPGQGNDSE